jgi:hypothetical protein
LWGENEILRYNSEYSSKMIEDLRNKLSTLFERVFTSKWESDYFINTSLSDILSKKIFHGIAKTSIVKMSEMKKNKPFNLTPEGLFFSQHFLWPIIDDYGLSFIFPKNYSEIFFQILKEDSDNFILFEVKNLIRWYLARKNLYIDQNTHLSNHLFLTEFFDNLLKNKEKVSFIRLKIWVMKTINTEYSFKEWDNFLKQAAIEIQKVVGEKW